MSSGQSSSSSPLTIQGSFLLLICKALWPFLSPLRLTEQNWLTNALTTLPPSFPPFTNRYRPCYPLITLSPLLFILFWLPLGECKGKLVVVDGRNCADVDGQIVQLWAVEKYPHIYFVNTVSGWFRWIPSGCDSLLLEDQRRQVLLFDETKQVHANLASMYEQSLRSESCSASPAYPSKEPGWSDKTAMKWLKDVSPELSTLRDEDSLGRSAIHVASLKGSSELVSFLLWRLDNIDARDAHSKTPLHFACEYGRSSVVRVLVRHILSSKEGDDRGGEEALLDARSDRLITPTMCASLNGHLTALSILLEPDIARHIDIWRKDVDGRNALHHAAMNGHSGCAELLLRFAGDASYASEVDKTGRTAVQMASRVHLQTRRRIEEEVERLRTTNPTKKRRAEIWLTFAAFACIAIGLVSGFIAMSYMGDES